MARPGLELLGTAGALALLSWSTAACDRDAAPRVEPSASATEYGLLPTSHAGMVKPPPDGFEPCNEPTEEHQRFQAEAAKLMTSRPPPIFHGLRATAVAPPATGGTRRVVIRAGAATLATVELGDWADSLRLAPSTLDPAATFLSYDLEGSRDHKIVRALLPDDGMVAYAAGRSIAAYLYAVRRDPRATIQILAEEGKRMHRVLVCAEDSDPHYIGAFRHHAPSADERRVLLAGTTEEEGNVSTSYVDFRVFPAGDDGSLVVACLYQSAEDAASCESITARPHRGR
jgi:hypothetical protein